MKGVLGEEAEAEGADQAGDWVRFFFLFLGKGFWWFDGGIGLYEEGDTLSKAIFWS